MDSIKILFFHARDMADSTSPAFIDFAHVKEISCPSQQDHIVDVKKKREERRFFLSCVISLYIFSLLLSPRRIDTEERERPAPRPGALNGSSCPAEFDRSGYILFYASHLLIDSHTYSHTLDTLCSLLFLCG